MKTFSHQNYYELLGIAPDASEKEIQRAYRDAVKMYGHDSLASYAFFDEGERKDVLHRLECAYNTLIHAESRVRYDGEMVAKGYLAENELSRSSRDAAVCMFRSDEAVDNDDAASDERLNHAPLRSAVSPLLKVVYANDVLTGADLRKIRENMGISLKDISIRTKIRMGLLEAIEADDVDGIPSRLHLKSFLRAYAQCLVVDADMLVRRYVKRFL